MNRIDPMWDEHDHDEKQTVESNSFCNTSHDKREQKLKLSYWHDIRLIVRSK